MPGIRKHDTQNETKTLKYENHDLSKNKPLYILTNRQGKSNGRCYCTACQKLSVSDKLRDLTSRDFSYQRNVDAECPECGNKESVSFVAALSQESQKDSRISYDGAWELPMFPSGRYVYEFTDKDGNTSRVEDNTLFKNVIIFPSGKTYQYEIEYSQAIDLANNSLYATRTRIDGKKRTVEGIADSLDSFQYSNSAETFDAMKKWGINQPGVGLGSYYGETIHNKLLAQIDPSNYNVKYSGGLYAYGNRHDRRTLETFSYQHDCWQRVYSSSNSVELTDTDKDIDKFKYDTIVHRFEGNPNIHPVYLDTYNNGLNLAAHHIGSNEGNTEINHQFKAKYMLMMIKYPLAFEYACERANNKVVDWTFKEKRKGESNPDYEVKTDIPDSLRAKYFREEMEYVSTQLFAVDDKILKTIANAKSLDEMKKNLAFYAFGNSSLSEVPKEIKLAGGETLQKATDATKKLKKAFAANPIATASNVYTCQKLGIRDINHVMSVIDIANASPNVHLQRHKRNGKTVYYKDPVSNFRSADVIVPVMERNALSFLKNYAANRNVTSFIEDVYGDDKFSQVVEDIRIYSQLKDRALIANTKEQAAFYGEYNARMRMASYLKHGTIEKAYVDFIDVYEADTKKMVDMLVYQVKSDAKLTQMKHDFDEGGYEALVEKHQSMLDHFPPYMDNSKTAKAQCESDLKAYTEKFFTNYQIPGNEVKVAVTTRNDKPLFENRNIQELHDELNHMFKGVPTTNEVIKYTQDEKALEATYPSPEDENLKWSFELHKDTNEMIRTSTELHNCLKSHTDAALRKRELVLFMKNELGEKVACISLRNRGDRWECDECQGDHDVAIDERYKDVINKWAEEHNIYDGPNRNMRRMGERDSAGNLISFHGVNADYHHEEIDETTGAVVSVHNMQNLRKKREELATNIYGLTDDGQINVPEAAQIPDYLM